MWRKGRGGAEEPCGAWQLVVLVLVERMLTTWWRGGVLFVVGGSCFGYGRWGRCRAGGLAAASHVAAATPQRPRAGEPASPHASNAERHPRLPS